MKEGTGRDDTGAIPILLLYYYYAITIHMVPPAHHSPPLFFGYFFTLCPLLLPLFSFPCSLKDVERRT